MEQTNPNRLSPGEVIHLARLRAHLDLAEVADYVGKSKSTISNWEHGIGEPTITAWIKIAEVTGAGSAMLDLRMAPPTLQVTDRELGELEPTQLALPLFRHLSAVP